MPVQECEDTTTKCKRKWMMLHQEEESACSVKDDSLTSLQWLQGFSIPSANPESLPKSRFHQEQLYLHGTDSSASPTAATGAPQGSTIMSVSVSPKDDSCSPQKTETSQSGHCFPGAACAGIDFKRNYKVKPPYSYATLICMAMRGSQKSKLTLSAIYDWITENFCYYRNAEPSWQNSIRHNLSLNKCFRKVPRQKHEPGKGGFWEIDPQHADMFVNGIFKRKRINTSLTIPKHSKAYQSTKERIQTLNGMQYVRKQKERQSSGDQNWSRKSPLLAQEMRGSADSWAPDACEEERRRRQAFDDLELSTALHSLNKEMEDLQPGWHVTGHGNWFVAGPEPLAPRFVEVTAVGGGPADCPTGGYPQQVHGMQLSVAPSQQYYEELTMFPDQQVYSWDCLREEVQAVPVAVDNGVGVYDGFLYEMQPWDRAEPYIHEPFTRGQSQRQEATPAGL